MVEEGDVIEIRVAPSKLISGNRLQVMVNNIREFFDHEALRMQDFNDASIIANEAKGNLDKHGNFTVIFKSGVGVIVAVDKRRLYVKINLPPQYKNMKTEYGGLLGTWNDNRDDDLTLRGSATAVKETSEEDFKKFALSWVVKNKERLFRQESTVDTPIILC